MGNGDAGDHVSRIFVLRVGGTYRVRPAYVGVQPRGRLRVANLTGRKITLFFPEKGLIDTKVVADGCGAEDCGTTTVVTLPSLAAGSKAPVFAIDPNVALYTRHPFAVHVSADGQARAAGGPVDFADFAEGESCPEVIVEE